MKQRSNSLLFSVPLLKMSRIIWMAPLLFNIFRMSDWYVLC